MCGIAGIYKTTRECPVDPGILANMTARLIHRGPDDEAFHVAPGFGLGFRRLSIIDLEGGRQPFVSDDGRFVSACNGEIYNWRTIRKDLEARSHRFRTSCDTEVVLHAYREWGPSFVKRMNGQFAYAVYDSMNHSLCLGRDQTGIAPMFYSRVGSTIVFASEIKAILDFPGVEKRVNLTALDQILTFPGIISPHTMFEGIHALRPGHYITVSASGIEDSEYWDLVYPEETDASMSEEEAATSIDEALRNAIDYRLKADVPVGFYLSGGLDSSLVGSIIHSLAPDVRRHSFSIGFDSPEIDERRYQAMIVNHTGSMHHEIGFHPDDIERLMPEVIRFTECPLKETYDVCSLMLSSLVRENGMKVVLTGEGADELFAGYVGYRMDTRRGMSALDGVEAMMESDIRNRLWGDDSLMYERDFIPFREIKEALYHPDLAENLDGFDCCNAGLINPDRIRGRHPAHKRSYLDFKLRLADHLLSDHGDRMAYGNSVEARYPFLDKDFIETATSIPPHMLVKNNCEKYILKKAAGRHLPPAIVDREKFSFVAPGSPYLLANDIGWAHDLLDISTIKRQGYFNAETISRLKSMYTEDGFSVNQTFDNDLLMIVLTFGLFLKAFDMPDR